MAVPGFAYATLLVEFTHFSGYKLKIKPVLRIMIRGNQALILIFTILKFSAQEIKIRNPFTKKRVKWVFDEIPDMCLLSNVQCPMSSLEKINC